MENNLPVVLSLILAITASFIPLVSLYIQNKHQINIKELDLQQENFRLINLHKREIFDKYLTLIGDFASSETETDIKELTKIYYSVLPYIPKEQAVYFREFTESVAKFQFDDRSNLLLHTHVIPCIKKEIETTYRE